MSLLSTEIEEFLGEKEIDNPGFSGDDVASSLELVSRLLRPPNLKDLQDFVISKYGRIGPHLLPCLHYAIKLLSVRVHPLLKNLGDSANKCLAPGEKIAYGEFVKLVLDVTPKLKKLFMIPTLQNSSVSTLKKNEIVASFVNFLSETLQELKDFSSFQREPLATDKMEVLLKELRFMLIFLGETSIVQNMNIFSEIEAVANEAGRIVYSFFDMTDQVTITETYQALNILLLRIEKVNSNVKKHDMPVSKLPSCPVPTTTVVSLFIVDSLLDNLDFLLNHEADLIFDLYDLIMTLRDELMLSRSLLNDKEIQQHSEIEELIKCVVQLRDIAYEADHVISSFVVGEARVSYTSKRISDFIQRNKLIMTVFPTINLNHGIRRLDLERVGEVSEQAKGIPVIDEVIVGFDDLTLQILEQLLGGQKNRQLISIIGMPGIGKTTLARKLYNSSHVHHNFSELSWCVVSQTYQRRKLLTGILSSLSSVTDLGREENLNMDDESLAERLYKSLIGRKYLIVMDDVWNTKPWNDLQRYFPDNRNGSKILITSRLQDVAIQISPNVVINELSLLSRDHCWELLQKKTFPNGDFPQELSNIGRKIAAKCHGLPLAVVVIARFLANLEKKESLWQEVAANLSSYISEDPSKDILELSYNNLPIHLKPCFLYFAAFKEDQEIRVKKLLSLWVAEGFIPRKEHKSLDNVAEEYLMDLINRSLVQISKRRLDNRVKSCTIHDLLHNMCLRMAEKNNFLKVIKDQFSLYEQHYRLFILSRSQTQPFGHHISSLLGCFWDPYICPRLKLLKVLEFSTHCSQSQGIEDLVHLRYLAISRIPVLLASIGRLKKLEFLFAQTADNIPQALLNLPKLRHLHISDPVKFNDSCDSSRLNKLETLSFVYICRLKDEEILRCSPNLHTLKCIFEEFEVDSRTYRYPNLNFLTQLRTLKLEISGSLKGEINIPIQIKKLTLSKSYLPWGKMSIIGELPNLEILKIVLDAFIGRKWNTKEGEFSKLKSLKLDRVKLIEWNVSSSHFPRLERLVLQRCNYPREIPPELGYISTLRTIEAHSCSLYVRQSVREIQKEQEENGNEELEVVISGRDW